MLQEETRSLGGILNRENRNGRHQGGYGTRRPRWLSSDSLAGDVRG
jgi:hypothetical protein